MTEAPSGTGPQDPLPSGRRLRLARLARGLSQAQLASQCGVSRQAVAGAESGSWSPSLAVALRLGAVLKTSVEELFAEAPPAVELEARSIDSLRSEPSRVQLARVWERWVALPLAGDRAALHGFLPASGTSSGSTVRAFGGDRRIAVSGCDPALPLLGDPLAASAGWGLAWWPCGSGSSEGLLLEGLVHAAAVHHGSGDPSREFSSPAVAAIGFAGWREGLLSRPEQPCGALDELAGRGLRLVNRESGAEARRVLDLALGRLGLNGASLPGYETEAGGHLQVASAIAAGLADAGVASEPAALTYGLHFTPLTEERCVLLLPRERLDSPELDRLLAVLGGPQLRRQLGTLAGYDCSILGEEL